MAYTPKWKLIEVDIKSMILIGVYDVEFNGVHRKDYFYKAMGYDDICYAINTSKKLYPGIRIKARVKGIRIYKNKAEMHLTHVSILKKLDILKNKKKTKN